MALLMPSTSKNFVALADEAADELFNNGTTLSSAVADIAKREALNPEEVRRLVEKANVIATVRMLRISTDRKATIALAEVGDVLDLTHPAATTSDTESDGAEPMPEQEKTAVLKEHRRNAFMDLEAIFRVHGQVKTAQEFKRNTAHVDIFKKRRALEEAKMKKVACEIRIKDSIDYLASEFSKYEGPDFEKFAAEVVALHGKKSAPVLASLAQYLRCKADLTKTADYIIDDTTKLHRKIAEVCTGLADILKQESTIATLSKELSDKWNEAKGLA